MRLYILSGERLEPVQFHLHVQRQNDFLAVDIPSCTTPCFEGTHIVIIIHPLDTETKSLK